MSLSYILTYSYCGLTNQNQRISNPSLLIKNAYKISERAKDVSDFPINKFHAQYRAQNLIAFMILHSSQVKLPL